MHLVDADAPELTGFGSLRQSAQPEGTCIADGGQTIVHMAENGARILALLATERWVAELAPYLGDAFVHVAEQSAISQIVGFPLHRGAIARFAAPGETPFEQLPERLCLLDGITDAENVGGIARTAAAFGFGMIIGPESCSLLHRRAIRVSMGAVARLPHIHVQDTPSAVEALSARGIETWIADAHEGVPLRELRRSRICVVFGGEANGAARATRNAAAGMLRIAMPGKIDSLNVAASAAIVLHHFSSN